MSSQRDMPEPWASAAIRAGFTKSNGTANLTKLAEAAGVAVETVRRLTLGKGRTEPANIQAVADALKIDVTLASEWAGQRREVAAPYVPPQEADLLGERERAALDELIRAMAAARSTQAPVVQIKSGRGARAVGTLRQVGQEAARKTTREFDARTRAAEQRDREDVVQVHPEDQ